MNNEVAMKKKFELLLPHMNERTRRLFVAEEARQIGRGGIEQVHKASGYSRPTIIEGIREIESGETASYGRIRKKGGGRKTTQEKYPGFETCLDELFEGGTRGDPESPLQWTIKSTYTIVRELAKAGIKVNERTVSKYLKARKFSFQGCCKTLEGTANHPDRDKQFQHINSKVKEALRNDEPVISVDTKKKELAGNYYNHGTQWRRKGSAPKVSGHDFAGPEVSRAYPYGIWEMKSNRGFVNVGTDHDTSGFAGNSIPGWWKQEGSSLYPNATTLAITADGGGSNSYRRHGWKIALQKIAEETGLKINVCHFPPGTSKWNKIGHRLFSFISSNWRGEPLIDYETIVNFVSNTKTAAGLKVSCRLDHRKYKTGKKYTKEEIAGINIARNSFHGEWNYTILSTKNDNRKKPDIDSMIYCNNYFFARP
jgi:transposase